MPMTIHPQVTLRPFGSYDLLMKKTVLVPVGMRLPMPSLAKEVVQSSLSGSLRRCLLHSCDCPVSGLITEFAKWWPPWIGLHSERSGLLVIVVTWLASASVGSDCGERRAL
jgi:hypothetical protein